jgi:hypothetical protein
MTTWEVLVGVWAAEDEAMDGAEGPFVSRAVREAVLRGGLVEPVAHEHFVAVPMLMHGLTLYHRLTATERNIDVLAVDPDLAPLREPASMGAKLPTGEAIALAGVADHRLAGPPGWLQAHRANTLLAIRLHRAQVIVEPAGAEPRARSRSVGALVEAAEKLLRDAYARGETLVEIRRVVWAALAFGRHTPDGTPYLIDEPVPPLGEVLEREGFACTGEWLHKLP